MDPQVHAVTEEAIARVEQHANKAWLEKSYEVLCEVASRQATLTADDVWSAISRTAMPYCHERSALGIAFRRARRDGIIALDVATKESQRPGAHRRPCRQWKSLVYHASRDEMILTARRKLHEINETIVRLDAEAHSQRAVLSALGAGQPVKRLRAVTIRPEQPMQPGLFDTDKEL